MNEQLKVVNDATNSVQHEWFFCDEDYSATPVKNKVESDFGVIYNSKFIEDGGNLYLFFVSQTQNKLVTLRFIDPNGWDFEIHSEIEISGIISNPAGIDVVYENGKWTGLITNIVSPFKLVKVVFGPGFQTIANYEDLSPLVSLSTPFDVKTLSNDGNYVTFVTSSTGPVDKQLARLSFGSSMANVPAVSYIGLPAGSAAASVDFYNTCDTWTAFVSSRNGKLFRVDLGANPDTTTPTVVDLTLSETLNDPGGLALLEDHNELVLILQSRNGYTYAGKINSVSDNTVEIINFANINSTSRDWGVEAYRLNGAYKIVSANFSSGTLGGLYQLGFTRKCPASKEFSVEPFEAISFHEPGEFKITLKSTNGDGKSDVMSKKVVVAPLNAPQITVTKPEVYCVSSLVGFSLTSDVALTEQVWDFGDGTGTSSDQSPTYSYTGAGTFNVLLRATAENGCANLHESSIAIYNKPQADFELTSELLCTNNESIFSASTVDVYDGSLSYQWHVQASPVSNERNLTHTFTSVGEKEITLQVSIPGCNDEITKTTSLVQPGPAVDFSYEGMCEDQSFSFENQITDPVTSFEWDFDNGYTSTEPNPSQVFTDFGNFSVSLTAMSKNGCESTRIKTIAVASNPLVDFAVQGPPSTCADFITLFEDRTVNPDGGDVTNVTWDFGDAALTQSTSGLNSEHIYQESGDFVVSVTATTVFGCVGTAVETITIHPSPSTSFTHTPACEDAPVLFTGPPDTTIESSYWEIGTSYSYDASPTHTFAAPGDYPLYAEFYGSNGCISTIEKTIHVPAPLTPDFSVIKNCVNYEAIFTDLTNGIDAVATRTWDFGDGPDATTSPVNHLFSQQGTVPVTLHVTTQSGCSYTTTKEVEILPAPTAQFSVSPATGAYPLDVMFENTSAAADHFEWSFLDGTGNTSSAESPTYTFSALGTFDVTLTAYNAQECEDSFTTSVTTVAPLPDADIEMIQLVGQPDGSTKLIVTIHNKGNTILRSLPMTFDFAGDVSLSHTVTEPIMPDSQVNFILNTSILNAETLAYLCVSLDVENDLSPDGNRSCSAVDAELFVFPAYPNPTTSGLRLEWISPLSESINVSLVDRLGRTLLHEHLANAPGLNIRNVDLGTLPAGLYLLILDDGSSKRVQRITIER